MELKEAIKYFENFTNYTKDVWKKEQKEKFDKKYEQDLCKRVKMFELLLNYIKEESIPRAVVEEKIKQLKEQSGGNVFHIQQTINSNIRLLQEILNKGE